jgi:hypothetical protein
VFVGSSGPGCGAPEAWVHRGAEPAPQAVSRQLRLLHRPEQPLAALLLGETYDDHLGCQLGRSVDCSSVARTVTAEKVCRGNRVASGCSNNRLGDGERRTIRPVLRVVARCWSAGCRCSGSVDTSAPNALDATICSRHDAVMSRVLGDGVVQQRGRAPLAVRAPVLCLPAGPASEPISQSTTLDRSHSVSCIEVCVEMQG